jgi:hypothetical protein
MGEANFKELSANDIKKAGSFVDKVKAREGDETGEFVANILARAGDKAGELAVEFDKIDWGNMNPELLAEKMSELGINATYAVDELDGVIGVMQDIQAQDFSLT